MFSYDTTTTAIFDVDGTLVDSMHKWRFASERYLLSLGLSSQGLDTVAAFDRGGLPLCCQEILRAYPQLGTCDQLIDNITMSLLPMYRDTLPEIPHAYAFLRTLSQANVRMCVLTANLRAVIEPVLQRLDMLPLFSQVICCCESTITKHDTSAFFHCAQALAVAPRSCVMFEDQPWAAESAKAAGMRVVGICTPADSKRRAELTRVCDCVVSDYSELIRVPHYA